MNGMVPGLLHAGNYAAATHWLKAVKAAGTTDADAVVAKMKATPVNDMYNTDVKIREDGRVMHVMHLWQVKTVSESKYPYDYCKELVTIPPDEAWRPLADGGCPLVKSWRRHPIGMTGAGPSHVPVCLRSGWSASPPMTTAPSLQQRRLDPLAGERHVADPRAQRMRDRVADRGGGRAERALAHARASADPARG